MAKILHLSERTLQRQQPDDALNADASERAILLDQLFHRGREVLETPENFNDWLRTPLPTFEQKARLDSLDTTFGFQMVTDELGRMGHGVFA